VPLLIDGHNLIGTGVFPDIRLSDEDDEAKLVARLKIWRSRYATDIVVIFDRGVIGGRDLRLGGSGVEVIFATDPIEADDLIRRRLKKRTPGLLLVTNDEALLQTAAVYDVTALRGKEFVERMSLGIPQSPEPGTDPHVRLTPAEIEEWLAIFHARKKRRLPAEPAPKQAADTAKAASKQGSAKAAKSTPPRKRRRRM
jgi:uncharacterized protein